jgi:Ca2+/Na+ antiporter
MIDYQLWSLIGGIGGSIIGVAAGIIGTYYSIKRTEGPRERAFVVNSAVLCWVGVTIFLGFLLLLPNPYRWLIWVPYAIALPIWVWYANRRQQQIREDESAAKK